MGFHLIEWGGYEIYKRNFVQNQAGSGYFLRGKEQEVLRGSGERAMLKEA